MKTRVSTNYVRLMALAILVLSILLPYAAAQAAPSLQAYSCSLSLSGPAPQGFAASVTATSYVSCSGGVGRIEVRVSLRNPNGTVTENSAFCYESAGVGTTSCSATVTAPHVVGNWVANGWGAYWNINGQNTFTPTSNSAFIHGAVNRALGALAAAKSTYPGYMASHVNDGSTNTTVGGAYSWANADKWVNPNGALPQWLQLDLGATTTFSKVVIYTSAGYPIRDYDVQVSSDAISWGTVGTPVRGNTSTYIVTTFPLVSARYVRINALQGPSNQPTYVRVNEFQVY
jgi:hypothetical protein